MDKGIEFGVRQMSLIHHLQQVADYRIKPLYPLWVVMLLVIMGIMSGCTSYRALESFVERHQSALLELMELPYKNRGANHQQW
jgi:hypothetical protein